MAVAAVLSVNHYPNIMLAASGPKSSEQPYTEKHSFAPEHQDAFLSNPFPAFIFGIEHPSRCGTTSSTSAGGAGRGGAKLKTNGLRARLQAMRESRWTA